jgi:hypothetical protein
MSELPGGIGDRLLGHDVDYVSSHAPCDVVHVDPGGLGSADTIALVTDQGPFDSLKLQVADAIASATGADIELVHADGVSSTPGVETLQAYHEEIAEMLSVSASSTRIPDNDDDTVVSAVEDAEIVIAESDDSAIVRALRQRPVDGSTDPASQTLLVRPNATRKPHLLSRLAERLAF